MNTIKHKHHHMKRTILNLPNQQLTSIISITEPVLHKLILPYHKIPFNKHKIAAQIQLQHHTFPTDYINATSTTSQDMHKRSRPLAMEIGKTKKAAASIK